MRNAIRVSLAVLAVMMLGGCTVLWVGEANTDTIDTVNNDTVYWHSLEQGTLTNHLNIVNDPVNGAAGGKVYEAFLTGTDIANNEKRAEWAHPHDANKNKVLLAEPGTEEVWLSWYSLFGGVADTYVNDTHPNDGNYMQIKGDTSCGGPAVGLTIRYGHLVLRTVDGAYIAWVGPAMSEFLDNQWHYFQLHVYFAEDNTGYVDLWVDEESQLMTNGNSRIFLPTLCPGDSYAWWKLGVYNMDQAIGAGPHHWVKEPTIEVP